MDANCWHPAREDNGDYLILKSAHRFSDKIMLKL